MSAALPEGTAILLIGHGSVSRAEDIPAFVSAIRRGRPTPQAIVDEVTHRWNAIGGSPLQSIIEAEARALSTRLSVPVGVASRLWAPYAKDVVPELARAGATRIVSLPLAPYSAKIYNDVTREACAAAGLACLDVPAWGTHPALVEAFAETIDETRRSLASEANDDIHYVLTAHSLPMRVVAMGDTYETEIRETAAAVTKRLALPAGRVHVAFQSQGMDGGDWLGPDLKTTFASIAGAGEGAEEGAAKGKKKGEKHVIVCAIGFLADHTEVLYDLDVEAKAMVEERGMRYHRAPSLNTRPRFLDALEVVGAVPECDRSSAGRANSALGIPVVQRTREGDDADSHASPADGATVTLTTSSITESFWGTTCWRSRPWSKNSLER